MKSMFLLAAATSLALGGGAAAPALAQGTAPAAAAPAAPPAPAPVPRKLSRNGVKTIQALRTAADGADPAAYQTALAAAKAAAENGDDRYVIAQVELNQAIKANDNPGKLAALQAMIGSGGARPEDLPILYENIGGIQYELKDYAAAAAAFEKLVELTPTSTDGLWKLAELRAEQKDYTGALVYVDRAIALAETNGQAVDANWYKRGRQFAYDGELGAETGRYSRALLAAYPADNSWRDVLLIYRQASQLDDEANLDLMRLMRETRGLTSERDYYELADSLDQAGLPAEAVAVIDDAKSNGIDTTKIAFTDVRRRSSGRIAEDRASLADYDVKARSAASGTAAFRTANAYLGYGDYAKAADLYRVALTKGSIDADTANMRMGIALAKLGQRAEAEAALNTIAGPRRELAMFWLLWISQQA